MNYLKTYCSIIRRAQNRVTPEGYVEEHHIFPRSIYGNNNRVVSLTAREHFIAHLLLEKIMTSRYGSSHPNSVRARGAIYSMGIQHKSKRYINNRLYEAAKLRWIETISGENHWHSKLDQDIVATIRWYWNRRDGFKDINCRRLSIYFEVAESTIKAVYEERTWKGIEEKLLPKYNYLPLLIRLKYRQLDKAVKL